MSLINCEECGKQISDKATVCLGCGAPLTGHSQSGAMPVVVTLQKNRIIAVILAMLLGGLGIHKFYLGRHGWGFVYLLFCWTLIPSFLGLFEGIYYFFMSDEKFQQKYGTKQTDR